MIPVIVNVLAALVVLAWARPLVLDALRALHILQLEEYQTVRFWRWLVGHRSSAFDRSFLIACALAGILGSVLPFPVWFAAPLVGVATGAREALRGARPEAKKPLVLTARARRLLGGWVLCTVVTGGLVFLATRGLLARSAASTFSSILAGLLVAGLLIWPLMSLANLLLYPIEEGFRQYYLASARRVLARQRPVVIGVAGSYGKTSTKSILAQILATRYRVLATPRSFNTPMGLCRVIREQLRSEHRYFIAELGAYRRGEIRQLCKLVKPEIGILTAVGPEHLERFGSFENVVQGEFEIVASLPLNGLAIFNGEDEICRELAGRSPCPYVLAGGPAHPHREIWAEGVELTSSGLRFTICLADGRRAEVAAPLLGRHNVTNILTASIVALRSGLPLDDLVKAISALEPVEHRLQLIPNENGVVVIDDTYNSNPRGAATALETLAMFQAGRRYLVTPGMVELGTLQQDAHREFGRQAAAVCDGVILIGPKQTRAIAEGLIEAGFSRDRLLVTRSLAEATERLKTLLRPGDAVLFENDLPDNYDE